MIPDNCSGQSFRRFTWLRTYLLLALQSRLAELEGELKRNYESMNFKDDLKDYGARGTFAEDDFPLSLAKPSLLKDVPPSSKILLKDSAPREQVEFLDDIRITLKD